MRRLIPICSALVLALVVARQPASSRGQSSTSQSQPPAATDMTKLQALAALEPIDTHTHVAKADPSFYAMLDRLHMHVLDILLVDDHDPYRKAMERQREDALRVVRESHGHAALCTSFDPFQFGQPDFPASAIRALDRDFSNGAVAMKIWKNVGMELKDREGHYVLPDNPAFEPIFQDIQQHNRTLVAHIAEPDEAWQPPNPNGLDYSYYKENPIWYMFQKPEAPRKQSLLEARDHVVARNPKLRVVGAHLGSMEDDLDGLAKHFDAHPNFAVDTAARVSHLVVQPSSKVREFILKYQDRIVYGTDLGVDTNEAPQDAVKEWEEQYSNDWRYFSTSDVFEYFGHKAEGLGLPQSVLRKIYHDNAVHWIPGVVKK